MRKPDYTRRVVVTGLGVISPVGNDNDTAWSNLVNGVSGLGEITRFDASPLRAARRPARSATSTPTAWMDAKAVRRSETRHALRGRRREAGPRRLRLRDHRREPDRGRRRLRLGRRRPAADDRQLHGRSTRRGPTASRRRSSPTPWSTRRSGMIAIETGRDRPQHLHRLGLRDRAPTTSARRAEAIRRGDCIAVISGSTEAPLLEVAHAGFGNMRGLGLAATGRAALDGLAPVRRDAQRVRPRRGRRRRSSSRTSSWRRRAARGSTPRSSATARRPTAGT